MSQIKFGVLFCFLAFIATIIGCENRKAEETAKIWKHIDVRVDTLLTLGESTSYFLIFPNYIVTDSEGRILVGDMGQNKVLVFSQDGEFLYPIGNKGRGPAEFTQMAGLGIDSDDIVTIFDRSAQLLKTFHSSGEFIKTIDLGEMIDSRIKFGRWRGYTLMNYKLPKEDSDPLGQEYLHIYDQYERVGEGVSPRDFEDLDKRFISVLNQFQGSNLINEDIFYFAPFAYNGDIYKYQLSEDNTTVQVAYGGMVKGYTHKLERTLRIVTTKEPALFDVMRSGGGTRDYFIVYNQSLGLFQLKDGRIVHFTDIESADGNQRTFGAELYDSGMQPIGYAPITTRMLDANNSKKFSRRPWNIRWQDEEDYFYFVNREIGKPIQVHVVKFNFEMD